MNDIGKKYHRLTIIGTAERTWDRRSQVRVRCDCGTENVVVLSSLKSGRPKSCGCWKIDFPGARTHGKTETGEYRVWSHMIGRCYNETDHKYPDYGARGIRVCERWRESFNAFLVDMGPRPSPEHSIDRRDNAGNYEPANCHWATATVQGQNKRNNVRITLDGESLVVAEVERRLGISRGSIVQVVRTQGLTHQAAVDRYVAKRRYLSSATPAGSA